MNDLRNTFITRLYINYGDSAALISDHSDIDVIKKNYTDSKFIAEAATDFDLLESKKK